MVKYLQEHNRMIDNDHWVCKRTDKKVDQKYCENHCPRWAGCDQVAEINDYWKCMETYTCPVCGNKFSGFDIWWSVDTREHDHIGDVCDDCHCNYSDKELVSKLGYPHDTRRMI